MFSSLSKKSVGALALFWSGSALAAGQCFAPSDPVRLTPDQQRAVVLNIRDNPDVFQSDFSLMRTLKNILGTVPGGDPATVTDDAAKDLLNSLLAGFGETSLRNDDGDISFTLVPRDGEKSLTADDLLGQTSPNRMVPVALFNRLDLTPADHSHCGEYRIVFPICRAIGNSARPCGGCGADFPCLVRTRRRSGRHSPSSTTRVERSTHK